MTFSQDPEQVQQAADNAQAYIDNLVQEGLSGFLLQVLVALLILIVGRLIVRWIALLVKQALGRTNQDPTLLNFVYRAVTAAGMGIVFIIILSYMGIPTTSIIAVVGAFSLAIGLALQDSLSNLASGLLIIILRPYKAGEFVQIGVDRLNGTVMDILFFHTQLRRVDNSVILVPNRDVMGNSILNFTDMEWRRIDLVFGIDYGDDILKAKQIMEEIVASEPRITDDPPARIAVGNLGDSSVDMIMQPFVRPVDYIDTKYSLIEQVKLRFDEAGITIPFPQRTLHLTRDDGEATAQNATSVKSE